jgi:hypothetical protein
VPTSLSSHLGIDSTELTDRGAFDPVLDLDTRLFLDPHLLKHCEIAEFEKSYESLQRHFIAIAKLLSASKSREDALWRKADSMMRWPEVKGLCIGYSTKGTSGSGIGPDLRGRLLKTAQEIIAAGHDDPELFELVGLFESNFGCDRISDMTANVITNDLAKFTARILGDLDVDVYSILTKDEKTGLPKNPYTAQPLMLVPKELLRDLPVSLDWSDIDKVSTENEELRERLNLIVGDSWRQVIESTTKEEFKNLVLKNSELLDDLISTYSHKTAQPYNFAEDRSGEYIWYPATQKATKEHPLSLQLAPSPTIDEVENLVLKICDQFRVLIEDNGLSTLLYNSDGSLKPETAAQLLFYGVCESYCDANGIMIARESDSGRGPVDFKFGTRKENSVLVEIKKSTNTSGLKKGVEKQLPQYMNSEKSRRAIYLVIDVGFTKAATHNLKSISEKVNGAAIKVIHVDGAVKRSASKL